MSKGRPEDVKYIELHVFLRPDSMRPVTEADGDEVYTLLQGMLMNSDWHSAEVVICGSTEADYQQTKEHYDQNLIEWSEAYPVESPLN